MQLVEVTPFAVRSAVIHLRAPGSSVRFVLYPMVHMARASFYAAVTQRLASADVIVAEGVRRPSAVVSALTLSYRILRHNRRVDLVQQHIDYGAFGVPVVKPDVDAEEFGASWRRIPVLHRLLVWVTLPAIVVGRLFVSERALWSAEHVVDDLPSPDDEAMADRAPQLLHALLGDRDRRLLAALYRLHEQQDGQEIAVVYGAAHLPAVVQGLRSRFGYVARAGEWLTVADLDDPPLWTAPRQRQRNEELAVRPEKQVVQRRPRRAPEPAPQTPVVSLPGHDPDDRSAQRVEVLLRDSDRWAQQGQPEEALAAADRAVDLAEALQERWGGAYNRLHGSALFTLGRRLAEGGQLSEAVELVTEALAYRRLARHHDMVAQATALGPILVELARLLLILDRADPARAAAQEAVTLYRAANAATGQAVRPWAQALTQLSRAYEALGQPDQAADAARRAANVARAAVT